jgi:hypothetical protein
MRPVTCAAQGWPVNAQGGAVSVQVSKGRS